MILIVIGPLGVGMRVTRDLTPPLLRRRALVILLRLIARPPLRLLTLLEPRLLDLLPLRLTLLELLLPRLPLETLPLLDPRLPPLRLTLLELLLPLPRRDTFLPRLLDLLLLVVRDDLLPRLLERRETLPLLERDLLDLPRRDIDLLPEEDLLSLILFLLALRILPRPNFLRTLSTLEICFLTLASLPMTLQPFSMTRAPPWIVLPIETKYPMTLPPV